jgi:hypothetical protein
MTAQEITVPVKLQIELFQKILTFERHHQSTVSPTTRIGVIYQNHFRMSADAFHEISSTLNDRSDVELIPIDLDVLSIEDLDPARKPHILVLCPLRSYPLDDIIAYSRKKHILSATLVYRYVEEGISVGLLEERDRPVIVINFSASQLEHANFDSRFLKLVRVLNP